MNKDWLLTGEGEMLNGGPAPEPSKEADPGTLSVRAVPLYNLDVRLGFDGNLEDGEHIVKMIPWEGAREGDFAVTTAGTSMMPVILPGSHILLRRVEGWREFLEYNILYVLELADWRRLLKLVQKSESPDALTLISYNPNNPPQDVSLSFINQIFKVVAIRTDYGY